MEKNFNVGLKIVTKIFEDPDGKVLEYERLEIVFDDGVVITAKVDKSDVNLLKWILKIRKEEEFNE